MSKRAERRHDEYRKYKKRLKVWLEFYRTERDRPESWKALEKLDWSKFLKNTPTPCSCAACQPEEDKYDRNKQKHIDNSIVDDELIEWDQRYHDWDETDYSEIEDYYNDLNRFYRKTG